MNPNYPQNNAYPPLNPYDPHANQVPNQYNQPHPPTGYPIQNQTYQAPQQYIQPGYVPVVYNPYGNLSPEEMAYKTKLDNIDNKFKNGFLKCYLVYMYFSLGWTIVNLVSAFASVSSYSFGWSIILLVWTLYACSMYGVESLAITEKSLTKANIALALMIIYTLPIIAALTVLTISYINWIPDPYVDTNALTYLLYYLGFFFLGSMLLFHFIFNLVGAIKVRRILGEREIIIRENSQFSVSLP